MEGEELSSSQNVQDTAKLSQIKCWFWLLRKQLESRMLDDSYSHHILMQDMNLFRGNRGESSKNPTCIDLQIP